MTAVKDYEVTKARFIHGQHRKAGDVVPMTPRAAKYYKQPHGEGLNPVASAAAAKSGTAGEKSPAKGRSDDDLKS